MTEQETLAEFAKQFDTKTEAEARARELGPAWTAIKSFKCKGKFQLSRSVGYII